MKEQANEIIMACAIVVVAIVLLWTCAIFSA